MQFRTLSLLVLAASLTQAQLNISSLTELPANGTGTFSGTIPTSATTKTVRVQSWSQPQGTLLPNWSFEAKEMFWSAGQGNLADVRKAVTNAASGKFVAQLSGTTAGRYQSVVSDDFSIKAGQTYSLSMLINGNTGGASIRPMWQDLGSGVMTSCPDYTSGTAWLVYKCTIPPQSTDKRIILVLGSGSRSSTTTLMFDNVLLVEGDTSSLALDRNGIVESGSISDPMGMAYHSYSKSGKETNYRIQSVGYDAFWRPETTYLPFFGNASVIGAPIADRFTSAKNGNASLGGGSRPFYQSIQPTPSIAAVPKSEAFVPGDAFAPATGHGSASGWAMVNAIPGSSTSVSATVGANLEAPAIVTGEMPYRYSWSRDRDGAYQLSWSNRLGQVLASARMINKASNVWTLTTYQYYPTGQLKTVVTPIDAGRVTTTYDVAGRVIARQSADQGTVRFWYDAAGRLAFRKTALQANTRVYTYWGYDAQGRVISEGELVAVAGADMQALANNLGVFSPVASGAIEQVVERIGYIYDEVTPDILTTRTGVNGATLLTTTSGVATFPGKNGWGRLVAKYHKNPQYTKTDLDAAGRLVVDFYGYDDQGRVLASGKYMGAVAADANRRQAIEYRYDSAGRVSQKILDRDMSGTLLSDLAKVTDVNYKYTYDDKGRLSGVKDNTTPIAVYTYNALGQLKNVAYGGMNTGSVSLKYHLHGQLSEVQASNGNVQYLEKIGYEAPYLDATKTNVAASANYSGRLSQVVEQFGDDQNVLDFNADAGTQSVKATNYAYDAAGRMVNAQGYVIPAAGYGMGGYVSLQVPYAAAPAISSSYNYDANDRLIGQTVGASTASYVYPAGSNRLNAVMGKIKDGSTRDASAANNFTYDADGNQIRDNSKPKWAKYGSDGLPVYLGSGSEGSYVYPLYDADGQMVTAMMSISNQGITGPTGRIHYVRLAGATQKMIRETWDPYNKNLTATSAITNLMGQGSVIGRKTGTATYQFYIKNHQGSTMRVVDINGNAVSSYDYTPYGDLRTLKETGLTVAEKWTGKERFDSLGLYYFGARWYDAELGIWQGPDPMHQFASPYTYGAFPQMGVDPNGMSLLGDIWDGATDVVDYVGPKLATAVATAGWNVVGGAECALTAGSNCDFGYVVFSDDYDVNHVGYAGWHGVSPGGQDDVGYSGTYNRTNNWAGAPIYHDGQQVDLGKGNNWTVSSDLVGVGTGAASSINEIGRMADQVQSSWAKSQTTTVADMSIEDAIALMPKPRDMSTWGLVKGLVSTEYNTVKDGVNKLASRDGAFLLALIAAPVIVPAAVEVGGAAASNGLYSLRIRLINAGINPVRADEILQNLVEILGTYAGFDSGINQTPSGVLFAVSACMINPQCRDELVHHLQGK